MKHIPTTATFAAKLKADAKAIAKKNGSKLAAELENLAKAVGYADYHHLTECLRNSKGTPTQKEFKVLLPPDYKHTSLAQVEDVIAQATELIKTGARPRPTYRGDPPPTIEAFDIMAMTDELAGQAGYWDFQHMRECAGRTLLNRDPTLITPPGSRFAFSPFGSRRDCLLQAYLADLRNYAKVHRIFDSIWSLGAAFGKEFELQHVSQLDAVALDGKVVVVSSLKGEEAGFARTALTDINLTKAFIQSNPTWGDLWLRASFAGEPTHPYLEALELIGKIGDVTVIGASYGS